MKQIVICCLTLLISLSAHGQQPAAQQPIDLSKLSVAALQQMGTAGDAAAQTYLANRYYNGAGIARDYGQALAWYLKAANQGNVNAQNALGVMYASGQGVTQDYGQAATWYRKAADQGLANAQNNLGNMYFSGPGLPQDYGQALIWYRKAADLGHAAGQTNLGRMYYFGAGVSQDYGQALILFRKAADQGFAAAQYLVGSLYDRGQGVPQDYGQALIWYQKAVDQGMAAAQNSLGNMYYSGHGVSPDYRKALTLFRKAADQGLAEGQFDVGKAYFDGQGAAQDYGQALIWYQKAADQGFAPAESALGLLYYKGLGVPQDYVQALALFNKAASQHDAAAQNGLGFMYLSGIGLPKDITQARIWLNLAAAQGDPSAKATLAYLDTPKPSVPPPAQQASAAQAGASARVVQAQSQSGYRHFSWMYQFDANGQPRRDWYEQPDGSWWEVYTNGTRGHLLVNEANAILGGVYGKFLMKDDQSIYVFVANNLQSGMWLTFSSVSDATHAWQNLGQITTYPNTARPWNSQIAAVNQDLDGPVVASTPQIQAAAAPASPSPQAAAAESLQRAPQAQAKNDIDASDVAAFQQKLLAAQREKIDIPKTMHVNNSYKQMCLSGKYYFDGGGGGGAEDSRHACVGLADAAPPELREQLLLRGCSYPDRVGTGTDPCWQLALDYESEGRFIEALAAYASPNLIEGGQNEALVHADEGEAGVYLKLGNRAKATAALNEACSVHNDYIGCTKLQQLGQTVDMENALNRSDAQDAADKAATNAQEAVAAQNAADAATHRAAIVSAISGIGSNGSSGNSINDALAQQQAELATTAAAIQQQKAAQAAQAAQAAARQKAAVEQANLARQQAVQVAAQAAALQQQQARQDAAAAAQVAAAAKPPPPPVRVAYGYQGKSYFSYADLLAAARAAGNCAPHPETGEQAPCDIASANAPPAPSAANRGSPPAQQSVTGKGQVWWVGFAFNPISSVAVELSGDGSYGVGTGRTEQSATDLALNKCGAANTSDMQCNTGGTWVGSPDGSVRWYALAINRNARPADNQHLWSYGEGVGYKSQSDADQQALATCQIPNADGCVIVASGTVGGTN